MSRLAIVLGAMLALKLVARFTLIGAFTDRAIQFFAIVDAAVILLASPWVAGSAPRPTRATARSRTLRSAATLVVGLWATNLMLQFPLMLNRSSDVLEAILRLLTAGLGNAILAGPVGAVALWLLAAGISWGWLMLRLPRERRDKLPPTNRKERPREDQPNRNVPGTPRPPQPRVRQGPHR